MLLHLYIVLLEGQNEDTGSGGSQESTSNDQPPGISADCVTKSVRYPYFDGTRCVSCSVGTERTRPYFHQDKSECVSACPTEAPFLDGDRVCRPCSAESPYWDAISGKCMSC